MSDNNQEFVVILIRTCLGRGYHPVVRPGVCFFEVPWLNSCGMILPSWTLLKKKPTFSRLTPF